MDENIEKRLVRRNERYRFHQQKLPSRIDLRPRMPPIVDQADMNTCTGNAIASACEYIIQRQFGQYIPVSRLFIYFNGRVMDQNTFSVADQGATIPSVAHGLRKHGICREASWPYKRRLLNKKPPESVYKEARDYTVNISSLPLNINAIKGSLARGIPIVTAVKMKNGTHIFSRRSNGYIAIPSPGDTVFGRAYVHAVVIVGYDDDTEHFIVRNSWGKEWGRDGYFFLPYEYLALKDLTDQSKVVWTVTSVRPRTDQHRSPSPFRQRKDLEEDQNY